MTISKLTTNCIIALSSLLILPFLGLTQDINNEYLKDISIRNIGPAGMSGRVTAIDAIHEKSNTIYIGSASGGVWKSQNRGITWKPIFEHETTMSIGAVKITQSNPDVIWVGTGEGNPRNSHNSGKGIFKSIDGGETWTCMGLENTKVIHRIYIDEQNPDVVYAAAMGSAWGPSKDRGVYKTTDGGKTWKNVLFINDTTGAADMIVDPENHNKLYVAMWDHLRHPWDFRSGGEGSGLYVTYDGGENWKKLGKEEGLPDDTLGRIGLASATNKPDVLYALIETKNKQAIYRSDDAGLNWKMQSDKNVGNRPFYYSEIYVDPSNENRIFNLWSYVSKSEDGGKTFKTIMDYGNNVHPDHHAFWIDPTNPDYMIDGNDGGLNISEDGGHNWRFIENLPIGQFYHINIDNDFPYNVYGGMQDNGSWVGPTYVLKRGGLRNSDFQEVYFGDGFDIAPLANDNTKGYAMSQKGNVSLYDRETGRNRFVKPAQPDTTALRFSWNAAMALDPYNDCGLYFGTQYVHYSDDCGQSWSTISPDLTTNDKEKQALSNVSGGLTQDVTGAEGYTTMLAIAPSPIDTGMIWASSDDGRLHLTTDGGDNWSSQESRLRDAPANGWIPQIEVSKHDASEAFVVVNNYRQNDWKPYLYHTTNRGKSWKNIANPNVMGSFVCSVVQDPVDPNMIFAGLDDGLYISYNKGGSWTKVKEFPSVQIRDMKIMEREDDLVIGTFGRAIWVIDDLPLLRQMGESKYSNLDNQNLIVFPVEDAYLTTNRSVDGARFIAQSTFVGDNISKNARINYWIQPDSINEKSEKKVKFQFINTNGDTIRTFTTKPKKGLNTQGWSLNSDGSRGASWTDQKEDADKPGGAKVSPGNYTVLVTYGELSEAMTFNVKEDLRTEQRGEINNESQQAYYETLEKASDAFEELKSMDKELNFIKTYLKNQADSISEPLNDTIKSLASDIDTLQLMFLQPKDATGYRSNLGKLSELQWPTSNYVRSYWEPTTPNGERQLELYQERLDGIIEKIEVFKSGKYNAFKEQVYALPQILFEEDN